MKKKLLIVVPVLALLIIVAIGALSIEPHNHEWSTEIVHMPSCAEFGLQINRCKCGETLEIQLDKLEHTEGNWRLDKSQENYILICSSCGSILKSESISDHTHTWSEWSTTIEASCTNEGLKSHYCDCGAVEAETLPILNHTFSEWTILQDPSCYNEGLKERVCSCGEKETETIAQIQHQEGEYILSGIEKQFPCVLCGDIIRVESLKPSEGLEIVDGIVLGVGSCTDTEIIIPQIYNGKIVTEIAEKAFYKNSNITKITIPNAIKTIGKRAFYKCENLESINLNEITNIEFGAFEYCEKLTAITLSKNLTKLSEWSFKFCTNLKEIRYNGTISDWSNIEKGPDWDFGINDYSIICTDSNE